MANIIDIKQFRGGGLDQDSAPEFVAPEDYVSAINFRNTGTASQSNGYETNIESTLLLSGSLLPGINNIIGGEKFEDIGKIVGFRYNSGGNNQIILYDYQAQNYSVIYTDLTDSAGIPLLPLNPQNIVKCVLLNKTFLIWWAKGLEVGYTNLNTLASGGYGIVTAEDLSLLKPQCLLPPTGVYGSDAGQPANYWYSNLPVFNVQYVNADFNYSAWSTHSKRIVPYQENTPTLGANVGENNYIIIGVNIGSQRASTINIGRQIGAETVFSIIKSVDRAYILALPNTAVNVGTEIYEAYDPATNTYYYASYGNEIPIPVDPNETDLEYDYIWPSNAGGGLNGNIFALGDFQTLYDRPDIDVTISAGGYNPNIQIPAGTYADPLTMSNKFYGATGSGAGDHRRIMYFTLSGVPHTGDTIQVIDADIRNATATRNLSYVVPSSQNGDLLAVVRSATEVLPSSSYRDNGNGTYTLTYIDFSYYGAQTLGIKLFFAGALVANSIPTMIDNTSYQAALSIRDGSQSVVGGRFFPLDTGNTFIFNTPSYAQVNGNAIEMQWTINNAVAPKGAIDYQWMITKPPINNILDTLASPLDYKGPWDSKTNTPTLAVNAGTVGDTYQITAPSSAIDVGYINLGKNQTYFTGDYVVYNGQSWDVLPKSFGDLTPTGNILAFSLNPLKLFNSDYEQLGVTTNLVYDFAIGDRCTLHYYIDGGVPVFINDPCVNLSVFGYDIGTYIVKVEKPDPASFDASLLDGKNVFLRLYSPALQTQANSTTQQDIVWYEIGERFPVVNGLFSVLQGIITDGGAYYKTRQFDDALQPYTSPPVQTLATDLNYSDFYPSAYNSFGRVRTYDDELIKTERQASIIPSQPYILGSKKNGLTRFYPQDIYGDGSGQTSSSKGSIEIMDQRGDILVVIQALDVFYIPINYAWTILNDQVTGLSISEKLLNNGRYSTEGVGIGNAKESFWRRYDRMGFISPQKSQPFEVTVSGVDPMSGKMSQFFKSTLEASYSLGKKLFMFYNDYYEEPILCIQSANGIVVGYAFNGTNWRTANNFVIVPADVSATPNGTHSSASYNAGTGKVTYTPVTDYVGNDVATFTFTPPGGSPITLNNCLNWTAGDSTPNNFSFAPLFNQELSTEVQSGSISVQGVNIPVPISITGGEYSVNGGAFTSSAGTVNVNDTVIVQVLTSASNNTPASCTLTISTKSATFTATTKFADTIVGILVVDFFTDLTLNVSGYCDTAGVTDFYREVVYTGNNFNPGVSTPAADNWALASDAGPNPPVKRFEFNITKIRNAYPLLTSLDFPIRGRNDGTLTTVTGSYVLQSAAGSMIMTGSPGTYLPSVSGTELSSTPFSGYAIVGGADGHYGINVGAVILTMHYDITTNTVTIS